MPRYIYEYANWPQFEWDHEVLLADLGKVRHLQGKLVGKMEALGFALWEEATLETLTLDVIKSTEIEGEVFQPEQVRSSLARRLGMDISGLVKADRYVDGMVEMMIDATQKYAQPLTAQRLFKWHTSLFPVVRGRSLSIVVGHWRDDSTGPMQVVSGAMGREYLHYQAPPAKKIKNEMNVFLKWFNSEDTNLDPVLKSGIAHLWFITIHPFEDGNGRIARAIADLLLSRSDNSKQRFYSMSAQIKHQRKQYYEMLERTQHGDPNITAWLSWYLNCLYKALQATEQLLERVLFKAKFWERHWNVYLNDRQKKMLNKLLDGFEGKLNTSKWAKITRCSTDTALRDILELVERNILAKDAAGGRSTSYSLLRS